MKLLSKDNDSNKNNMQSDNAFIQIEEVSTSAGKTLLHPMVVDFPEGAVTAIMGPSGSGKTTMMNTLTHNVQSNIEAIAEVTLEGERAFVPQDDRLAGFYTPRSYCRHYLRLTGHSITPQTDEEINTILKRLGLSDQADTIVGDIFLKGLSGGQKRRLSVALEALTRPKNFFLDEPTSGLDAESALQLMLFLRSYARESPGRHVILTIHQPSSHIWQLIDNVVLLSKGKLMYQGPRSCMEDFFASVGHPTPPEYNPADHYVTIVNDEFSNHVMEIDEWEQKFQEYVSGLSKQERMARCRRLSQTKLTLAEEPREEIETRRSSSPMVVVELTRRYFMNLWFNPGILGTRVAMYSMLALGVGALFWKLGHRTDFASINTRAAVLFYCVAFFIFMSVAVLPFTVMERAIVDKEVRNGYYNPIFYQVAQGISTIPGAALLSGLTTLIIITMTRLNEPGWYYLAMFLSLLCAEALAQLVSHVVPHFVIGMALIAGAYGFFMLFMGFMLIPSDFPHWLKWTNFVPFHTYSWRTFMYSEFINEDSFESTQFPTGYSVLEYFEIEDTERGKDMAVLIGYALFIHVISCFVLYAKYNLFHGKLVKPTARPPPTSMKSFHEEEAAPVDGNGGHMPKAPEERGTMEADTPVVLSHQESDVSLAC